MTFEQVKVLPVPVAPSRVWHVRPSRKPSTRLAMACGWSPAGWNLLANSNLAAMRGSSVQARPNILYCKATRAWNGGQQETCSIADSDERSQLFERLCPDARHAAQVVHGLERLLAPRFEDALGRLWPDAGQFL